MSLSEHYLEEQKFSYIDGECLPDTQPGNYLHDGSVDGDHLDDENEEDNTSVGDQGDDRAIDPFI